MFIYDLSYGWPVITGAKIASVGASGVIGYAGCADVAKNVSQERLFDWLNHNLMVALVIENYATDAIKGATVGRSQGSAIVAAAKSLEYNWQDCVLFGGYDTNAIPGDYLHLLDYMQAFADVVPVPGYYGDSDSIDFLFNYHPDWIYWQSSSSSFSPKNPTENAHLWQQFADPRAHGLDVDVNNVLKQPLPFMGADMPLTDDELQAIAEAVKQAVIGKDADGKPITLASAVRETRNDVNKLLAQKTVISGGSVNVSGTLNLS